MSAFFKDIAIKNASEMSTIAANDSSVIDTTLSNCSPWDGGTKITKSKRRQLTILNENQP